MLTSFILNDKLVSTPLPRGTVLLDYVRYHQHLTGTKIGCREGDCGACTIVCGELREKEVHYTTMTSCLMPLGNAHGKHIVTIEGLNMPKPNLLQQAMHDEAATQCGFCTPGIVVSMAGFCLRNTTDQLAFKRTPATSSAAIAAVDGNICRCTGYKSIQRAAAKIAGIVDERNEEHLLEYLISREILPPYFREIRNRLGFLTENSNSPENDRETKQQSSRFLGGGTDLYVQQHQLMVHTQADFMLSRPDLKGIYVLNGTCFIGGSATVSDLLTSLVFQNHFPDISKFIKLVSSTPIRNMATIAGNFVNASPIGDLTIFFLALDAKLLLREGSRTREVALSQFYKGYKTLDKNPEEYIERLSFTLPDSNCFFNFEKVSKRTHLDIASVNTAMQIRMEYEVIIDARITAGGVAPIPMLLSGTSAFLKGRKLSAALVNQANEIAQAEISPISDTRGTATYKRVLLKQLIKAHFLTLFPSMELEGLLYS